MKVKLANIFNSWAALSKMSNADLPAKKSYALAKFMAGAGSEYELLEKQRTKLVEKYGEKSADGNVAVKPENFEAFAAEFNTLLDQEIELYTLDLDIDDLEGCKLSALNFFALTWLFDIDKVGADIAPAASTDDDEAATAVGV